MAPITAGAAGVLGLLGLVLIQWVHPPGGSREELSPNAAQAVTVFLEYVPLSLILLLVLEINRVPTAILATLAATLVVSRCVHAEALRRSAGHTRLRLTGSMINWAFLLLASLGLLWIAVRGSV